MTHTAKFHVDVEVTDSLTDATMDEIQEFVNPVSDSDSRKFLDYRDIDPANIEGVQRTLVWDFEAGRLWLRSTYEVRVPKRVWQSLGADARLDGDADG